MATKAKTKTRTKASSKGGAASLLDQVGKKGTGRTKSDTPQVAISDESMLESIAAIIDAKVAKKEAESALKIVEGAFRDEATDLFENRCRSDGTLHTSVRFMGRLMPDGKDPRPLSLQFVQTRRCKKMDFDEATDPLHSAFGEDYDDLFAPSRTIEIDVEKMTDDQQEAVVGALMEALGDDFNDIVSVDKLIVPKEAFFGQRILNAKIRAKADNAAADGFAVPFASSFKV